MNRTTFKRVAAAGASAALLATGMSVVAGTGVANADDLQACGSSNTVTPANVEITRKVEGDGTAAPGGTVTISTTVKADNVVDRYVNKFVDRYADGLTYVEGSAKVDAWHAIGGTQKTETVAASDDVNAQTVTIDGTGWPATKRKYVTSYVTYKVSEDAKPGDKIKTAASVGISTFNTDQNVNDVCVTVRPKNAVEQAQGSLENIGLGSVNSGSSEVFGSVTDPQGSISNILSDVLGNVLGDVIGS